MFRKLFMGAAVATPAPLLVALADPVRGETLGWPNVAFVVTCVAATTLLVGVWAWLAERPARCRVCRTRCRRTPVVLRPDGASIYCPRCVEFRHRDGHRMY